MPLKPTGVAYDESQSTDTHAAVTWEYDAAASKATSFEVQDRLYNSASDNGNWKATPEFASARVHLCEWQYGSQYYFRMKALSGDKASAVTAEIVVKLSMSHSPSMSRKV